MIFKKFNIQFRLLASAECKNAHSFIHWTLDCTTTDQAAPDPMTILHIKLPWVKHLLQKIYYPAYDVAFCIAFFSCLELLLPPQLVP